MEAALILGVLQARTSSTRLPQKVLCPVLGEPMLFRQIERIRRSRLIDKLIVATSSDASDDPLQAECAKRNIPCFRGSLDDVLDRFYRAAEPYRPDYVVRMTGDCPLADPEVLDRVVEYALAEGVDYASNVLKPTYPDGLDIEVFTFATLRAAWEQASLSSEREHVTAYIYKHPELFSLGGIKCDTDYSLLRWTVDEPEDLEFVRHVYEALYPEKPDFAMADILEYLQANTALSQLNEKFERNEGYQKSLMLDRKGDQS